MAPRPAADLEARGGASTGASTGPTHHPRGASPMPHARRGSGHPSGGCAELSASIPLSDDDFYSGRPGMRPALPRLRPVSCPGCCLLLPRLFKIFTPHFQDAVQRGMEAVPTLSRRRPCIFLSRRWHSSGRREVASFDLYQPEPPRPQPGLAPPRWMTRNPDPSRRPQGARALPPLAQAPAAVPPVCGRRCCCGRCCWRPLRGAARARRSCTGARCA